ncbi:hypothetical protein F3Y22_tig00116964pilonHSYRG00212 [Hibiscus syriacus]|uniref:Uncharacterized protein n=1 Tax=Hibiscus syriacus TaxID=106335 RepID=A0A6A2WVH3_HIBSY|nr:hypothetical protein F3Y22_tig00116964pilonHSYRG00212 [Hibiscus syriacus]
METTSKLRESVRAKRTELQFLRQDLKLILILKGQFIVCSTEALMASTLRLPVVAGARADIPKLKDPICSAVDIMQGISSSICSLFSKNLFLLDQGNQKLVCIIRNAVYTYQEVFMHHSVKVCFFHQFYSTKDDTGCEVNSLVGELGGVSGNEIALLDHCQVLVSTVAAVQVLIKGSYIVFELPIQLSCSAGKSVRLLTLWSWD